MINLSEIWKEKGQPKLFTIEGKDGLISAVANINWLKDSGIKYLLYCRTDEYWGLKLIEDSRALRPMRNELVNDTEFLRHMTVDEGEKAEFEQTLAEYRLRESLKITVLVA